MHQVGNVRQQQQQQQQQQAGMKQSAQGEAKLKAAPTPPDHVPSGSFSRAIADMLSPLLSNKKPAAPASTQSKMPKAAAAPSSYHITTDFTKTAREAFAPPSPQADSVASPSTPLYQPALFGCSSSALSADSSSSLSSCGTPASPDSPGSGAMKVFPALHKLVAAARNCALPAASCQPEAGSPNYPTVMLALSPTVPPRMQRSNWCLDDYTVTEQLYKGYASTVLKAFCKRSSEPVVLKVYALSKVCDLYKYQIFREVRLHSMLQHENIVTLHAAFQEGDNVVLVEEYADGADLFSVLQKHGGRMSERLAMQMVLEPFIRVLHYLHSKGIIHRDIKPENIMFSKNMVLKLGDFGLAINIDEERAVTRAGTLDYMAPEVLQCPFKSRPDENKSHTTLCYSSGVDSWAVGVLAFELLVGWPPFYDEKRQHTEDRILTSTPSIPGSLSGEARDFISRALSKSPHRRLTIQQMLHHPWVDGYRKSRSVRQVPPAKSPQPDVHSGGSSLFQPSASVAAAAAAAVAAVHQLAATPATPRQLQPQPQQPQQQELQRQQQKRVPVVLQRQVPLPSPSIAVPDLGAMKLRDSPRLAHAPVVGAADTAAKAKAKAGTGLSTAERLLDGKSSLKEYLQEQMLKQQKKRLQQQQQQQQQPAPARTKEAVLPQAWNSRADGTVVMNVRNLGAKVLPYQDMNAAAKNF